MQGCRQVQKVSADVDIVTRFNTLLTCTGKPFVGNLLEIPPKHSWLKFKEWADQYGSIYRINIFGRNLVMVSTEKIANDLLRERGNIYSSREQLQMAAKLMSQDLRPLLLPHGGKYSTNSYQYK